MRYVAWDELGGMPNVIVDGYPAEGTVLTLSHWRGSGSPDELADDLSTQIAFRYLDRPDLAVEVEAVSNNHFDEDGLCGIFAVLSPGEALARRDMLIDVASTGDFDVYRSRDAARVRFALGAYADEERSPLGEAFFARPYPRVSAGLYEELLPRVAEMVDRPERSRALWEAEDAWLARDEERLSTGAITIEERPQIDLAVVTLPDDAPDEGGESLLGCHPAAVHPATLMNRVLVVRGNRYLVRYRYETWVRYVSRPTMPRIDLTALAEQLSAREPGSARWVFEGVENITPSLRLDGAEESAIAPEEFVATVEAFLTRLGDRGGG